MKDFETHPRGTVDELLQICKELRGDIKMYKAERKRLRFAEKEAFIAGYLADTQMGGEYVEQAVEIAWERYKKK
jgi:hypothetical protein